MNSLIIFTENTYLQVTLAALAFFLLSGLYLSQSARQSVLSGGTKYLVIGLLLDFFIAWYGSMIEQLSLSLSVNFLVAVELVMKLGVLILLGMASADIMVGNVSRGIYAAGAGSQYSSD